MSILNNAIESLQIGLEDFKNSDPRRSLSAARNISAGVLLLFKEKLRQLSPTDSDEVLIKKDIHPSIDPQSGDVKFEGKGNKTVDVYQIKERFKSLKIDVDWKTFDKVIDLRNNIEHYYTEQSAAVINEIVSKSFIIIRDFCVEHLDEEPAVLLGQESWDIFLDADEIYQKEKDICVKSLSEIDWKYETLKNALEYIRCPYCQSELIMADGEITYHPGKHMPLLCKKEQHEFDLEEIIENCVHDALSGKAYLAMTDGDEYPYDTCPECVKNTYVYEEEICLACGYTQTQAECAICGATLDLEEAYEGNLCSYHQWQAEKDDD